MFLASLPADEEDLSERLLAHFKGRKELIEVVEHKSVVGLNRCRKILLSRWS